MRASQSHCIHEEEEGGGRALALGILVAASSLSLDGGLLAVGGLGDLDGLLNDLRLERHPDLVVEAAAVHVDEDDGDILVAGLAAWVGTGREGIRSRQNQVATSERAG